MTYNMAYELGSATAFERGAWLPWLNSHLNRELGVGALPGGWRDPPSRVGIDVLLGQLGRPQRRYESILVAGTNGKTTTARATAALLQAVGLTVGTFTSPHLDHLNERISVDGSPITDQSLGSLFAPIAEVETKMSLELSWFEIVTAAAMMWFACQEVDLAVIEVGLGGEYDATAVAIPALFVLTNIDLDHTEFFGATRREVASAEASIIEAGNGLVLGEPDPSLRGFFTRRRPHPLWVRGVDFQILRRNLTEEGQVLTLETPAACYLDVPITISGFHHAENISIALMAAECVYRPIPDPVVRQVLSVFRNPGRVELVCGQPRVLVDGAHNPAGARALAATLSDSFPGDHRTFVIGTSVDKPAGKIIAELGIRPSDKVVCCSAENPRALPASALAEIVRETLPCTAIEAVQGVRDALTRAIESLPSPELVVVTGSLYVVAEARRMFYDPTH